MKALCAARLGGAPLLSLRSPDASLAGVLVQRIRRFRQTPASGHIRAHLAIAFFGAVLMALDGNCNQAFSPFDQLKFAGIRTSGDAAVHLKEGNRHFILIHYAFRAECVQTKKRRVPSNCGKFAWIVPWKGNEGNHITDLKIDSATDFI